MGETASLAVSNVETYGYRQSLEFDVKLTSTTLPQHGILMVQHKHLKGQPSRGERKNTEEIKTKTEWRIAGGEEEEEVEDDLEGVEEEEEEKEGVKVEREGLEDAEKEGVKDRKVDRIQGEERMKERRVLLTIQ